MTIRLPAGEGVRFGFGVEGRGVDEGVDGRGEDVAGATGVDVADGTALERGVERGVGFGVGFGVGLEELFFFEATFGFTFGFVFFLLLEEDFFELPPCLLLRNASRTA